MRRSISPRRFVRSSPIILRSRGARSAASRSRARIARRSCAAIGARSNRVVANLIGNALKAEPVGGTVLVRLRPEGEVEVIDHGEGVAPCHRETIFEPFWRKSEATPGSGLGLAIAKELISKLHGRICVEETPGGGATFKLRFQPAE